MLKLQDRLENFGLFSLFCLVVQIVDFIIYLQPLPKPAIDLLAKQPVIEVESRIAVCDGGKKKIIILIEKRN